MRFIDFMLVDELVANLRLFYIKNPPSFLKDRRIFLMNGSMKHRRQECVS
jgi:hypothetical protein